MPYPPRSLPNVIRCATRTAAVIACIAAAAAAGAQTPTAGLLTGTVVDSSGAPVLGAQVVYGQGTAFTETDESGAFKLPNLPVGAGTLSVRRLGFKPRTIDLQLERATPQQLTVTLSRVAQPLSAVVVKGHHSTAKFSGRIAEFYERVEQKNGGVFITRLDIDRQNPRFLTDMLRTVPGMQMIRTRRAQNSVRMRDRGCAPLVWLDGIAMPAGEVDLDTFTPTSIEGIELYLGATTAPAKYTWLRGKSNCGTILLWTRTHETFAASSPTNSGGRVDLEALVASLTVYTADQVDEPARPDSGVMSIGYPPALYASKTTGSVMAEFVVDTTGRVEPETIGVVSSTHPLFTEVVTEAVTKAHFVPAKLQGHRVRQVVQLPFSFVVAGNRGKN